MNNDRSIQLLQQQRILLEMEYAAEKEAFRKQTETIGIQRKVKRGDAWFPITIGKCFYNSLNQSVVEVFRNADDDTEHNFEYGRPLVFFTLSDDKPRYLNFTASVSYVDGNRMLVVLPSAEKAAEMASKDNLGVQLSFDETSYRAMFDALDRVARAGSGRLAYLRDLFASRQMEAQKFRFTDVALPWLNATQQHAVNEVLRAKDVAIVHGPPGTGKTTTLVEAINETLARESQVLVCAQSNMAVDWISEQLVDRGINVLRIGNPTRVNDKMLEFTYERRFEAHPNYTQLWAIRKAIRELRTVRRGRTENWHQKMDRLRSREAELEIAINADLFGQARVIASTLVGASHRILDGQHFSTLFIDEAAQALEAACWIPIRRASRVILAGDHCQLPPTIKSIAAMKGGLDKTLMQRIVEHKPEAVTLLTMQYRMNEAIMRFSSDWFYHGEVVAAPEVKFRGILDLDRPMEWREIRNEELGIRNEEFVGENFGRVNKPEARETLMALAEYFVKIGRQRIIDERIDVGIISPYRAQVQYLRHLIKKTDFFKPFRKIISVNTVDGFQGQERDVILVSLVRSNEEGQIGFLRDLRRMNVAITRARMKLIILGDVATLTRHPFYKKLWEYCVFK
ncbi:MAG: AAA domain-containing protein [Prevotella sp.]|nr:AAA domain-containing protein [Prevotella sp.]